MSTGIGSTSHRGSTASRRPGALVPFDLAPDSVRALFARAEHPEGSWDWFSVLAQTTLAEGEEAVVLFASDARGEPAAAAACVRNAEGRLRALSAPYTTWYAPASRTPQDAETLGSALKGLVKSELRLDALDLEHESTRRFMAGVGEAGLLLATYPHFGNWYERVDSFETFWQTRGSQLREIVRRKGGRLQSAGRISFRCFTSVGDVAGAIDDYEKLYAASWKPAEPHPAFVGRLARTLSASGEFLLGFALMDNEPAAAQIWLAKGCRATIFKLVHKPEFDRYSLGTLLTHWLLERCVSAQGPMEIDFGRGDDAYKRQWLHRRRQRHGLIVCNPRSLGGLSRALPDIIATTVSKSLRRFTGSGAGQEGDT